VTSHDSLFLSRRYLRVLEEAGPENLRPCYALIFREKEPVAAVAAQRLSDLATDETDNTDLKEHFRMSLDLICVYPCNPWLNLFVSER
jgi:hypothetical protein